MTDNQKAAVATIVAAIEKNGFRAIVAEQSDGTVTVRREAATSFAVVGKRGGIEWR